MNTTSGKIDDKFQSITHGELDINQVILSIKSFLEEGPKNEYNLVIGTDSQEKIEENNGKKVLNIISAIVVHRKGFGGKYFWKKQKTIEIHSLREKIYTETFASLALAGDLVPLLKKSLNGDSPKYYLEIHVDVGEHGATREMIKEVVGMVTGNGFVAKTKPEAYGASYVADRYT